MPGVAFARPNDVESLEAALAPGGDTAPAPARAGARRGRRDPARAGFAQAAAELAREIGALLCVDEVQAGLGRTGTFFAFEQLGIEPDLVTLAKGLGNGLPIGALLAARRRAAGSARRPRLHLRRQSGRRAAACAVVEALDDELLAHVRERGAQLAAGLAGCPASLEVRGRGLLVAACSTAPSGPVVDACRERGLLVLSAGPDVLRLTPPLVVTAGEVDEALAILEEVLLHEPPRAQQAILRLVRDRALSTQAELVQALRDEGHDVVQTTVSRDVTSSGSSRCAPRAAG